MRFPVFGDCLGCGCCPLTFGLPFRTVLPHVCSSNSRTDSLECEQVMIFVVGDEDFLYLLFFFWKKSLFGWSLPVVISSPSGLFSFSLSKIPSPLVFALTGWKCQTAPLGKGRSTVARSNPKHFVDPLLLRRDGRPRNGDISSNGVWIPERNVPFPH